VSCTLACWRANFTLEKLAKMFKETLHIPVSGEATLFADIVIPDKATSIVIFSHGSGSSRFSPRNKFVATLLQKAGIATLLLDLLTPEEDRDYDNRFEIPLLTQRLIDATEWIRGSALTRELALGYFGASTGAAAALGAAAHFGESIRSVVCRGGRPDLAKDALPRVKAAVLLIVGGLDMPVIQMNKAAYLYLESLKELVIIPGASHLFEEPGKLEEMARHTCAWFEGHLQEKHSSAA
jgi:putative phosphoribosyl transferase